MSYARVVSGSFPREAEMSETDRRFFDQLRQFSLDARRFHMVFPPTLTRDERKRVHVLARLFSLGHKSADYLLTRHGLKPLHAHVQEEEEMEKREREARKLDTSKDARAVSPKRRPDEDAHGPAFSSARQGHYKSWSPVEAPRIVRCIKVWKQSGEAQQRQRVKRVRRRMRRSSKTVIASSDEEADQDHNEEKPAPMQQMRQAESAHSPTTSPSLLKPATPTEEGSESDHEALAHSRQHSVSVQVEEAEEKLRQPQRSDESDKEQNLPFIPPPDPQFSPSERFYYHALVQFMKDPSANEIEFSRQLKHSKQVIIHRIADYLGLIHESVGSRKDGRFVRVRKHIKPSHSFEEEEEDQDDPSKLLQRALRAHKQLMLEESRAKRAFDGPKSPCQTAPVSEHFGLVRYASWNIEWMNQYFKSDTEFHEKLPEIPEVKDVLRRIAGVIIDLEADVLNVQEGPRTKARMELFVSTFLADLYEVFAAAEASTNNSDQCIYFLVRRDGPLKNVHIFKAAQDFLQEPWEVDVDGDLNLTSYSFSRTPVIIQAEIELPVLDEGDQAIIAANAAMPNDTRALTRQALLDLGSGKRDVASLLSVASHSTDDGGSVDTADNGEGAFNESRQTRSDSNESSQDDSGSTSGNGHGEMPSPCKSASGGQQHLSSSSSVATGESSTNSMSTSRQSEAGSGHLLQPTDSTDGKDGPVTQQQELVVTADTRELAQRKDIGSPLARRSFTLSHSNDEGDTNSQDISAIPPLTGLLDDTSERPERLSHGDNDDDDYDDDDSEAATPSPFVAPPSLKTPTADSAPGTIQLHEVTADDGPSIGTAQQQGEPQLQTSRQSPQLAAARQLVPPNQSRMRSGSLTSNSSFVSVSSLESEGSGNSALMAQAKTERKTIVMCGVHSKSKYVSNGRSLWESQNPEENREYIRTAVRNRRRIVAENLRIQRCLKKFVSQYDPAAMLIVSGDLNDGPGMDFFEHFYVLTSSVDSLLGSPFYHNRLLRPILIRHRFVPECDQWTVVFDDFVDNDVKKILIDHIFASDTVFRQTRRAGVAHAVYEKYCGPSDAVGAPKPKLPGTQNHHRAERPSDHRPVFADIF